MDGYQLARSVRKDEVYSQIPLIAVSSLADARHVNEGLKAGFNVYLEKLNQELLLSSTAKLIEQPKRNAVEAIAGISQAVEKLNGLSGVVAAAVEEQTATTNEISRVVVESKKGVENIADIIKSVSLAANASNVSSNQTLSASKELGLLAEKLSELAKSK